MRNSYRPHWPAIILAALVIIILTAWWWRGQSNKQPDSIQARQTSDIRATDTTANQNAKDAINAINQVSK